MVRPMVIFSCRSTSILRSTRTPSLISWPSTLPSGPPATSLKHRRFSTSPVVGWHLSIPDMAEVTEQKLRHLKVSLLPRQMWLRRNSTKLLRRIFQKKLGDCAEPIAVGRIATLPFPSRVGEEALWRRDNRLEAPTSPRLDDFTSCSNVSGALSATDLAKLDFSQVTTPPGVENEDMAEFRQRMQETVVGLADCAVAFSGPNSFSGPDKNGLLVAEANIGEMDVRRLICRTKGTEVLICGMFGYSPEGGGIQWS